MKKDWEGTGCALLQAAGQGPAAQPLLCNYTGIIRASGGGGTCLGSPTWLTGSLRADPTPGYKE